jgi:hypothetical protein
VLDCFAVVGFITTSSFEGLFCSVSSHALEISADRFKIQQELQSLGLDPSTLGKLSPESDAEASTLRRANGAAFQYAFDGETS